MKKWFVWALVAMMAVGVQAADKKKGNKGSGGMDADKDGKVSKEEFVASQAKRAEKAGKEFDAKKAEKMFDKNDKNGDGFLTGDEIKASGGQKQKKKKAASE